MHHPASIKREYRADIDGLRSIAVLSVFLFHLQPGLLPGGFLGVDVFFVISGYLITGIILREHHLRTFCFSHFYARRIKRIFPALFVVLAFSAVVATFLLVPETYTNFMQSARYAAAQLANFFFSQKVDYFSEGFSGQPLLHTWSLGVEEQFYLFWPLLIYICFRFFNNADVSDSNRSRQQPAALGLSGRLSVPAHVNESGYAQLINRKIAGVLLLISVGSCWACFVLAATSYNLAFYMFYTRAFEFCIGGFIALKMVQSPGAKSMNDLTGLLGILMLFFSFFFIKEEFLGRPFLQGSVVIPCIGSALIIYANSSTGSVNRILATRIPAAIGKISYSLYLYHWPVIIFYKLYTDTTEIGLSGSFGIIVVSFILSILSYLYVEQPARKTGFGDYRVITLAIFVIVGFSFIFKNFEQYETASWRITRYDEMATTELPKMQFAEGCQKRRENGLWYFHCQKTPEKDTPIIALVGDSHGPHYILAVTEWAKNNGYDVKFLARPGCPMLLGDIRIEQGLFDDKYLKQCQNALPALQTYIVDDPRVAFVLVAQRFDLLHDGKVHTNEFRMMSFKDSNDKIVEDHTQYYHDQLAFTLEQIRDAGKEMVILKQVPIFSDIDACNWEPGLKKLFSQERLCDYDTEFIDKWQKPSSDFIDEFALTYQVDLFDPAPYFDSPLQNGFNTYHDTDHLSEHGVRFMVPHFSEVMDGIVERKKVPQHARVP
jgi:peptidoglycan/LPS O-acetylase OafA/YrhL